MPPVNTGLLDGELAWRQHDGGHEDRIEHETLHRVGEQNPQAHAAVKPHPRLPMTRSRTSLLWPPLACLGLGFWLWGTAAEPKPDDSLAQGRAMADSWRTAHRIIDLHQHINSTKERCPAPCASWTRPAIGIGVNLGGGTVTRTDGNAVRVRAQQGAGRRVFPGRFVHYMNLDYAGWD